MRVDLCIAVTGKVLGYGQYIARLGTLNVSTAQLAHQCGVFAERAHINNRIIRIGVYIKHRHEIHIHAQKTCLLCCQCCHIEAQLRIARRTKPHLIHQVCPSTNPCSRTALAVRTQQQGNGRTLLEVVAQFGQAEGIIAHVHKPADLEALDFHLCLLLVIAGCHKELTNLLLKRHPRHQGFDIRRVHKFSLSVWELSPLPAICFISVSKAA